MADLEDRLLKKNIPGKYSWWDEYNEGQQGADGEDNDGDDAPVDVDIHHESSSNRPAPPPTRGSTKAGIKGVQENYKLDQDEVKRQALIDRMEKEDFIERNTTGVKLKPGEVSISLSAVLEERKRLEQQQRNQRSNDDDEDDNNGDDADDNFIARYRQQRLQELQQERALSEFGGVEDVDPIGYSQAVDDTDPRVILVVHVYETYIPDCRTLAPILETISREMRQSARFLSLKASSFGQTSIIDPVALPSVLVHKGGALVANLTPITSHLPDCFGPKDVLQLLSEFITSADNVRSNATYVRQDGNLRTEIGYDNDSDAELDAFCEDFDGTL